MLFEKLSAAAKQWRDEGYRCADYPLIGEILRYQHTESGGGGMQLRYLRDAQFRALEVYWFLRLKKRTPHAMDIYKDFFGGDTGAFCDALGIRIPQNILALTNIDAIVDQIVSNDDFVRDNKLEPVREMARLNYPSYILALAMGAGKTVLIGAIIATEFAMAMAYRHSDKFMKNALVFAPGKTIVESLREIEGMPFADILPPALMIEFRTNLKIEYARDGKKDFATLSGSSYNIIVSNTEKIHLRAMTKQRKDWDELKFKNNKRRDEFKANLRLQKITSLPCLGVFSDEAHHLYGKNAENQLKRARETINYINDKTPLIAVVNTTGTPYIGKRPLGEVVFWYGLKDGINDGVLKELTGGIVAFQEDEEGHEGRLANTVISEFFRKYRDTRLPNGAKAKIAFYCRNTGHLEAMRPQVERAMVEAGEDISQMLVCTNESPQSDRDEFNRLNNPDSQKRVMLLVNIGTEGWNCPSLFACALIRKGTNSVFVLQAATRCLRQTPGNQTPASIFLNPENIEKLDRELQNNFRINRFDLNNYERDVVPVKLRLRKAEELPKLEITRTEKRVVAKAGKKKPIRLTVPEDSKPPPDIVVWIMSPNNWDGRASVLVPEGKSKKIKTPLLTTDCRAAAVRIAANYHLPLAEVYDALTKAYPGGIVPEGDIAGLFSQIEKQTAGYKIETRKITETLALVRLFGDKGEELFERDGEGYYHRLRYTKNLLEDMRNRGLLPTPETLKDERDVSFHYSPYNLASKPERDFLERMLVTLNEDPDDIAAFLYTGGITDARKTDFYFEYKGTDGNYHRYFPDFVLIKKSGKFYIVEIKAESERGDATVIAKEKALEKLRLLNPDKVRHEVIYCGDNFPSEKTGKVSRWLQDKEK